MSQMVQSNLTLSHFQTAITAEANEEFDESVKPEIYFLFVISSQDQAENL